MPINDAQFKARVGALQADVDAAYRDLRARRITEKQFHEVMDLAEAEQIKLKDGLEAYRKAKMLAADTAPESRYLPPRAGGVMSKNLSPMDIPGDELAGMFEAAKRKQPYRCEITTKTMDAGSSGIGHKTPGAPIAEGAQWPTGLFPPVLRPELSQELRYQPDRMADHIPTITLDAPSIEYLVHTGNTNPAAVVAELDPKPDIGMQLDTATAVPVKIAALASVSMEALQDFSYFASWVPHALTTSVINVETQQLVLGTGSGGLYPGMTGFVQTENVLTRSYNGSTDTTGLDTLIRACNDIRIEPTVYGHADLIATHPTTWDTLKRSKTTTDAFVLAPMDPTSIGSLDNLFGTRVIVNTMIPEGTAVVLDTQLAARYYVRQALTLDMNPWGDTQWTTNSISFRAEMRSVLAVLRPKAVVIVTGLDGMGS